jgi:uncharacterized protein YeaO (DUF488 family)
MNSIKLKRIYAAPAAEDGYRILVDRLWPRGVSKEKAALSEWAKDIAPSTEIRKEFSHMPDRMEAFRVRYFDELVNNERAADFVNRIVDKLQAGNVTLLYAAKDEKVNHALVLKEWLEQEMRKT